jgi:hypothetical protein
LVTILPRIGISCLGQKNEFFCLPEQNKKAEAKPRVFVIARVGKNNGVFLPETRNAFKILEKGRKKPFEQHGFFYKRRYEK